MDAAEEAELVKQFITSRAKLLKRLDEDELATHVLTHLPNDLQGLIGGYIPEVACLVPHILSLAPYLLSSLTKLQVSGSIPDVCAILTRVMQIPEKCQSNRLISLSLKLEGAEGWACLNEMQPTLDWFASRIVNLEVHVSVSMFALGLKLVKILFTGHWTKLNSISIELDGYVHVDSERDWKDVNQCMRLLERHAPLVQHLAVLLHRPNTIDEAYEVFEMEGKLFSAAEDYNDGHINTAPWLHNLASRLISLRIDWAGFLCNSSFYWKHLRYYENQSCPDWPEDAPYFHDETFPALEVLCVNDMYSSVDRICNSVRILHLTGTSVDEETQWPRLAVVFPNLEMLFASNRILRCTKDKKLLQANTWKNLRVVRAIVKCTNRCRFAKYVSSPVWESHLEGEDEFSECLEDEIAIANTEISKYLRAQELGVWHFEQDDCVLPELSEDNTVVESAQNKNVIRESSDADDEDTDVYLRLSAKPEGQPVRVYVKMNQHIADSFMHIYNKLKNKVLICSLDGGDPEFALSAVTAKLKTKEAIDKKKKKMVFTRGRPDLCLSNAGDSGSSQSHGQMYEESALFFGDAGQTDLFETVLSYTALYVVEALQHVLGYVWPPQSASKKFSAWSTGFGATQIKLWRGDEMYTHAFTNASFPDLNGEITCADCITMLIPFVYEICTRGFHIDNASGHMWSDPTNSNDDDSGDEESHEQHRKRYASVRKTQCGFTFIFDA